MTTTEPTLTVTVVPTPLVWERPYPGSAAMHYRLSAPTDDDMSWKADVRGSRGTATRFPDFTRVMADLGDVWPPAVAQEFIEAVVAHPVVAPVMSWQQDIVDKNRLPGPADREKTAEFVIPVPSFNGRECPLIPEGATEWEEQEIRSAWRQVHNRANDLMTRVESAFNDGGRKLPDNMPSANEVQAATQFVAARALLQARIDGCEHRLAQDRQRLEEIEEARRHEYDPDPMPPVGDRP